MADTWEDYYRAAWTADGLRTSGGGGGSADGTIIDGTDSNIKATVFDYTNSNPMSVRLTDTAGDYVGAGAGTQYTEDAAAAANPVGSALNLVRNDARSGSLVTTDGDNVAARGTNTGELYVKHVDAIPITDNSGSLTVDYATVGSGTATGALRVELPTNGTGVVGLNAGTNAIGKLAANTGVDIGDVDVTSVVPGTGATNLGKAVDSAGGSTDTGVAALFLRTDTPTTLTPADGDYARARLNSIGGQWVQEQFAPAYEDNTNAVAKVEHRYSYGRVTADGQIKSGAGFVHTISIAPTTATPTAGLVTVYDSLTETGTVIFSEWVFATSPAHTITLDVSFATGLYVGYDATLANASVTVSYR